MRLIEKYLLIFLMLLCQKGEAATPFLLPTSAHPLKDSGINNALLIPSLNHPTKRIGFVKKLQTKLLQKVLKHRASYLDEGASPKKNLLSTISLLLGLAGAIAIFIPTLSIVGVIAGPAALVTGIIALGKKNYNSKTSKGKAIVGLVLGSVLVFIALLGLILWAVLLNAVD